MLDKRKNLIFIAIFFIIILVFHFRIKKPPSGEENETFFNFFNKPLEWENKVPPDFEIDLLSGERFSLGDNIGKKIIIINFFATWCGPCISEMPELNNFFKKHKDEPFVFIGIDADETEKEVKKFLEDNKIEFSVGIDHHKEIQNRYLVAGYPTTVFIGAQGTVQLYQPGPIMNADIAFEQLFKSNLDLIKSGKNITKEIYLKNLKAQTDLNPTAKDESEELTGRAKELAQKMDCPCGCSESVIKCTCQTARRIKKKLQILDLTGKTDEEIIKELNKEFCVRDGKNTHNKS